MLILRIYWQFVVKEGDTVTPVTKVAVISKGEARVTHIAPSEDQSGKDTSQTPPPPPKIEIEERAPKVDTSTKEKPKVPSAVLPKTSASEPQLPPKERERRVGYSAFLSHFFFFFLELFLDVLVSLTFLL